MADVLPFQTPFTPSPADECHQVEQGLIGCLLMNAGRSLARVPETFSPQHYAYELHRAVHETVIDLGASADLRTISAALNLPAEDRAYLAGVLTGCAGWMATADYAHAVTEYHHRRVIKAVVDQIQTDLLIGSRDMPAGALVNKAMAGLDALLDGTGHYGRGGTLDQAMDAALAQAETAMRGETMAGRSTGMPTVDEALGGLENGTFNILGARPAQGKTALAVQWAVHVAKACKVSGDAGVLGFSLEMPRVALGRRVLAEAARIPMVAMKRGRVEGQFERLVRVRKDLGGLPLFIEDAGGQNLVAIRQKARAAQRRFKRLALIWVDHINIVKPDDADRKNGSTQAVGRISNALRDMSKEFDCPVLCLAQLNRGLLAREDKRPNLGDLRQAGDIEQDADTVMFIHREEAYLPKSEPAPNKEGREKHQAAIREWEEAKERCAGKAELIFEKVRDGAPCTVQLTFDGPTSSFSEPEIGSDIIPLQGEFPSHFSEPAGFWQQ
jgi:replicative DNA helicase